MKINRIFQLAFCFSLSFLLAYSLPTVAAKNVISNILPTNSRVVFIQIANSGTLIPTGTDPTAYKLVLNQVSPFTTYFTDRPNRISGLLPTNQFVDLWHTQDIVSTPPNVALETRDSKNGQRINKVLVLSNPIYDSKNQQIYYNAKVLDKNINRMNSMMLGYTVLFIDDFNWGGNKFGGS